MNKKTTKLMATALTATMGAGMATQLVQAAEVTPVQAATQAVEAMEKNPTGANIDKAYNAVKALKAGAEKDALYKRVEKVAAPHHKAVYDIMVTARAKKDLKTIGEARTAVAGMAKIFINDAYTWSSELDTFTIEYQTTVVETLNAIADGKKEVKQATINELRKIIVGLELQRSNEGLLKLVLDYSATLDKVQMDYVNEVVALVEKATTVDQIKVARAKYDDLMTMTNEALKAGLKADLGVKLAAKEAQLTTLKVESINAITATTVTVVLNEAPTKEVTASSFNVAGNTVKSVQKGNYDTIYTLTLGTSLDGKKGTLTVNGTSKDYDFTQLKLNSVNAKNLRQLEVKFSKAIDVAGIPVNADGSYTKDALLDNLHIWMTEEEDGSIDTRSFASILGTSVAQWHAYVQADKQTVIVESINGSLLTGDKGTGLGIKVNETYQVEAINVLDATGKYSDVSYISQILKDNVRPVVSASSLVEVGTDRLELTFSEPIKAFTSTGAYAGKARIYVDGTEVPAAAIVTDVVDNATVDLQRTVEIDTTKLGFNLAKGDHKVAVVGAEDLNGNLISNNGVELAFKIVDPADVQAVEPVVKEVIQVADNAFKVVFNTKGVTEKSAGNVLTIKKGAYDAALKEYKDIDIADTAVEMKEVPATATVPAHTEWVVIVDATATEDAAKLSYKGANVMTRSIEVKNFKNASKDGKAVTKSLGFKKDITAPVIAEDGITASADTLMVEFSDTPFNVEDNGKVDLVSGKTVTVKYTDKEGVTYSEEITTPTLNADGVTVELKVTNPNMLDNKGKLFAGENYTIVLPDALVKDAEEDITGSNTNDYVLLDGQHPFVGKTVTYKIPGAVNIGLVPQTTRGLIFTGYEKAKNIGAYAATATELTLKDNQIVVVFEGEVDAKTAIVTSNYTLNGKVLPQGSSIEYRQSDINNADGDNNASTGAENFVIISLSDDTIALTGGQDFTVAGVANKLGNKMMPVADVVTLSDNTKPVANALEIRDSNKLVLTFSEAIELTTADMTQLARNFEITVNGKTVSLLTAAVEDRTKLVITTADNFDNNGSLNVPASIKLKVDGDGNMFIQDIAANKAKAVTVTKK